MEERKKWFINAKFDKEIKAYYKNFDMKALGLIKKQNINRKCDFLYQESHGKLSDLVHCIIIKIKLTN